VGFISCIMCLWSVGCGKEKKQFNGRSDCILFNYDGNVYTEDYMVYNDRSGKKNIFSVADGNAMPYCFDPGCEHRKRSERKESGEIVEQGCLAYDYNEAPFFLCGDSLYFLFSRALYCADLQGHNRRCIVKLTKPYVLYDNTCWYTEDALYVAYVLPYEVVQSMNNNGEAEWVAGERKEKQEAGILRIPFSGEGEETIFCSDEYYDMQIVDLWLQERKLFFTVMGRDQPNPRNAAEYTSEDWQTMVEEERKHTLLEIDEYDLSASTIHRILEPKPYLGVYFYSEVFGIEQQTGVLDLYRYSGERIAQTELSLYFGIRSDSGIYGWDTNTDELVKLSETTGEIVRRSKLTGKDFDVTVVVGDSFFGGVVNSNHQLIKGYISAEDFWSGDKNGIIVFGESSQ